MIYCVEDERNIRELLVYTLHSTGFEAKGLENGTQLFEELGNLIPDLILLDIMLPGDVWLYDFGKNPSDAGST